MGKARRERCLKATQRNTEAAAKGCGLFRLSAELRNQIYKYHTLGNKVRISADGRVTTAPLARVNRQLRQEVTPMCVYHASELDCQVLNFDFRFLSRVLLQLSDEAKDAITKGKSLQITLKFNERFSVKRCKTDSLQKWLADCTSGVLPGTHGAYKFVAPFVTRKTFYDLGKGLRDAFPDRAPWEWLCLRHRFNIAESDYVKLSRYRLGSQPWCRYGDPLHYPDIVSTGWEKNNELDFVWKMNYDLDFF